MVIELFFSFLSFVPLCLGILGFKSEQYLPRWDFTATIRRFVYFLYSRYSNIFWSLIQLLEDKQEKK